MSLMYYFFSGNEIINVCICFINRKYFQQSWLKTMMYNTGAGVKGKLKAFLQSSRLALRGLPR